MQQHLTPIPNHCHSHTGLLVQCPGLSLTSANFCPLSNMFPSPLGTFRQWEQLLAVQGTWIPFPPSQLEPISSQARGKLQLLSMAMWMEGDRHAPVPSGGVTDEQDKAGHRTAHLQHPALAHARERSVADGKRVCPRKRRRHSRQGVAPALS